MKATKDGDMEQTEDHSCASRQVTPILNNLNNHMPVVLIVGMYPYSRLYPMY